MSVNNVCCTFISSQPPGMVREMREGFPERCFDPSDGEPELFISGVDCKIIVLVAEVITTQHCVIKQDCHSSPALIRLHYSDSPLVNLQTFYLYFQNYQQFFLVWCQENVFCCHFYGCCFCNCIWVKLI